MPKAARYLITVAAFVSAPAFDTNWVGVLVASYGASWLAASRAEGKLTTSLAEFTLLGLVAVAGSVLLSNDPTAWLTTFLAIFASVYWILVFLLRLPRIRILDKLVGFVYVRWKMSSEIGDNDTLLRRARFTKNPYVLAGLLDAGGGVDINAPGNYGYTPLHEAARLNRNPDVLSVFLDHGADINIRGEFGASTLHQAVRFNRNPAVLSVLLNRGADISARDDFGNTPLHEAASRRENIEVAALLIDRGADINARNDRGNTPLHEAASRRENIEVATLLIDRGADVNARDDRGNTPLHEAASRRENTAVETLLLDRGADAAARNAEGRSPADIAADRAKDHKRLAGDLRQALSRISGRTQ